MTVKSSQVLTVEFTTANPLSMVAANADALPTGVLYINGVANAAVVTVTNITTGVYKASATLPALSAGDVAGLRISATVAAVPGEAIVWQETADTAYVGDVAASATTLLTRTPNATAGAAGGLAIVGSQMDLVAAPNATALAAVKTAVEAAGSTLSTLLARIIGTLDAGNHNPPLDAAGTRTALGLAAANLDATLTAIANKPVTPATDLTAVEGKADTLLTRLTDARAAKLDRDLASKGDTMVPSSVTPGTDLTPIFDAITSLPADSDIAALADAIDDVAANVTVIREATTFAPDEVLLTQDTLDVDGNAIGITTAGATVTAFLRSDAVDRVNPKRSERAETDGEWSLQVARHASYTLVFTRDGYFEQTAEVDVS